MKIEIKKCASGLSYWDVYADGIFIERFDRKHLAEECVVSLRAIAA